MTYQDFAPTEEELVEFIALLKSMEKCPPTVVECDPDIAVVHQLDDCPFDQSKGG